MDSLLPSFQVSRSHNPILALISGRSAQTHLQNEPIALPRASRQSRLQYDGPWMTSQRRFNLNRKGGASSECSKKDRPMNSNTFTSNEPQQPGGWQDLFLVSSRLRSRRQESVKTTANTILYHTGMQCQAPKTEKRSRNAFPEKNGQALFVGQVNASCRPLAQRTPFRLQQLPQAPKPDPGHLIPAGTWGVRGLGPSEYVFCVCVYVHVIVCVCACACVCACVCVCARGGGCGRVGVLSPRRTSQSRAARST